MTYLSPSGAYVRKSKFADNPAPGATGIHGSVIGKRVWKLLETPHTIESLRRAASRETQADRVQIKETLERLLDADLIELSPDS